MSKISAEWFKTYYNSRHYFEWYSQRGYFDRTQTEVDFIVNQTIKCGRVLDVGCGQGRHCIEFAQRGCDVVGIDISQKLIAKARQSEKELPALFFVCDARQMNALRGRFDLALSLFSSFGLHSHRDNCLIISNIHNSLNSGGFLFLDVDNIHEMKRYVACTKGIYEEKGLLEILVIDPKTNVVCWEEHCAGQIHHGIYQLYTSKELSCMLLENGFEVLQMYGSFSGEKYSIDSQRLIVVAAKQ